MDAVAEKLVLPFTFLLKREGDIWASLACEVDVASCGDTVDEAREALKDALELYVVPLLESGRLGEIRRPVSRDDLDAFRSDPRAEDLVVECHAMIAELTPRGPVVQFIPQLFAQTDCATASTPRH